MMRLCHPGNLDESFSRFLARAKDWRPGLPFSLDNEPMMALLLAGLRGQFLFPGQPVLTGWNNGSFNIYKIEGKWLKRQE
jgi:hypothetical protein